MGFFLIISLASSKTIQITNLDHNPGLFTRQDGSGFLRIGEHKLFHLIDLEKYKPIFEKLLLNIKRTEILSNFTETTELLKTKLRRSRDLMQEMTPKIRTKRGLLNFVGSGIKRITGNLDNDDLIFISHHIQNLQTNNKMLITQNNQQIQINDQFQNRINLIINQLKQQQQ